MIHIEFPRDCTLPLSKESMKISSRYFIAMNGVYKSRAHGKKIVKKDSGLKTAPKNRSQLAVAFTLRLSDLYGTK